MHIETIEQIIDGAAYEFQIEWEAETDGGIVVSGTCVVEGDLRHVEYYSIADLYRDCGGEYQCEPCEGGLMVFDSESELETWINQK